MKKTALLFLVLIVAIFISIAMFFVSWLLLASDTSDTEAFFHCLQNPQIRDRDDCFELALESTPEKGYRRLYLQK